MKPGRKKTAKKKVDEKKTDNTIWGLDYSCLRLGENDDARRRPHCTVCGIRANIGYRIGVAGGRRKKFFICAGCLRMIKNPKFISRQETQN